MATVQLLQLIKVELRRHCFRLYVKSDFAYLLVVADESGVGHQASVVEIRVLGREMQGEMFLLPSPDPLFLWNN